MSSRGFLFIAICAVCLVRSSLRGEIGWRMMMMQGENYLCPSTEKKEDAIGPHYLEDLMYKYGSDKSKDDHGYTDIYQMIFDPIRFQVRNVTEIGIAAGQSIQAWYHFFPNAAIHAYDITTPQSVRNIVAQLNDRVRYSEMDLVSPENRRKSPFEVDRLLDESMDLIVDDAMHAPGQQLLLLETLFRLVKPGGYYIIEDIDYQNDRSRKFHENIDELGAPNATAILKENDAVWVDAHIGQRDWQDWQRRTHNARSHVMHNSYLMIIHKRVHPERPVQINLRNVAMKPNKVVLDETDGVRGLLEKKKV